MSQCTVFGVVFVVLIVFLGSIILIWKYDYLRRWDHIARSSVQAGIAIASVAVALFLFDQQMTQQERRQFRQQALVVSSTLSTVMNALLIDAEGALELHLVAYQFDCETAERCEMSKEQKRGFEVQKEMLAGDIESDFSVGQVSYAQDIQQAVKTTNVLSVEVTRELLAAAFEFTIGLRRSNVAQKKVQPAITLALSNKSPKAISAIYLRLAQTEAASVQAATELICRLQPIERRISLPTFLEQGIPLQAMKTTMEDYSTCLERTKRLSSYRAWDQQYRPPPKSD